MAQVFNLPKARVFENDGSVGSGYQLFFYETGTSTKKTVYSDSALTTPLSNPVVADANGEFAQIFLSGTGADYKAVLGDATESDPPASPVWTADPVDIFSFDANSFDPRPFQHLGTTAGSATVYTLTPTTAITAYADSMIFSMQSHIDNTGTATIAISGLTALDLKKYDNTSAKVDIEAGDLQANQTYIVRLDGVDAVVLNPGIEEYTKTNDLQINNKLNLQSNTATISSGVVAYSGEHMILDGEGGAADALNNITGGSEGDEVTFRITNAARPITFNTRTSSVNIVNNPNNTVTLTTTDEWITYRYNGTYWAQKCRGVSTDFKSTQSADGLTYLPNGLIEQWGDEADGFSSTGTVTLPLTYPNNIFNVVATNLHSGNTPVTGVTAKSTSGFTVQTRNADNATFQDWGFYYKTVGN